MQTQKPPYSALAALFTREHADRMDVIDNELGPGIKSKQQELKREIRVLDRENPEELQRISAVQAEHDALEQEFLALTIEYARLAALKSVSEFATEKLVPILSGAEEVARVAPELLVYALKMLADVFLGVQEQLEPEKQRFEALLARHFAIQLAALEKARFTRAEAMQIIVAGVKATTFVESLRSISDLAATHRNS